ncbi:MAG TPA: hypothetical protein DER05_12545 [Lutibacter sp.]|nr:hypothetical protein [Lutibacter sp.]
MVLWFLNRLKQINNHYFFGVPRQLVGRVFRYNLFFEKKTKKRIFTSTTNADKFKLKIYFNQLIKL